MIKLKGLTAMGAVVAMSVGLTGCQEILAPTPAPEKAPEVVIQESIAKMSDLKAYAFDFKIAADLKAPNPEETPQVVKGEFVMDGAMDLKDGMDPRINLDFSGKFNADQDGAEFAAKFRMNKDSIFLNLEKLTGTGMVEMPPMVEGYLAKWWSYPVPAEVLSEMNDALMLDGSVELSAEQTELKTLVENTQFFKNIEYKGTENVRGQKSHKYVAVLDEAAFITFTTEASLIQGQEISDSEIEELTEMFKYVDVDMEVAVAVETGYMTKMSGTVKFVEGGEKAMPKGSITFSTTMGDFDKAVTVNVPAESELFPVEQLMGLAMGGMMSEMPTDFDMEYDFEDETLNLEAEVEM